MDLILWRHADAEEAGDARLDLERRLTERGERQAARIARWLLRQLPEEVRIVVSPAQRARQTAMTLERKFRVVDDVAPDASAAQVLAATGWPDARRPVVVVGHQPALGRAAALAMTGAEADWAICKGAVWWLRQRAGDDAERCVLVCVQSPEML
jgi:phosphohistidine phosphatase